MLGAEEMEVPRKAVRDFHGRKRLADNQLGKMLNEFRRGLQRRGYAGEDDAVDQRRFGDRSAGSAARNARRVIEWKGMSVMAGTTGLEPE